MAVCQASTFFTLLLLVQLNPEVTSQTSSISGSCPVHINGCSIPCQFPFPYKTAFTPACNKHDVCYSCGQMYGWTRDQCDTAFKDDMYKLCETSTRKKRFLSQVWNWIKSVVHSELARCKSGADIYYNAVDTFGESNFVKVSPLWCKHTCAKSYGDPTKALISG